MNGTQGRTDVQGHGRLLSQPIALRIKSKLLPAPPDPSPACFPDPIFPLRTRSSYTAFQRCLKDTTPFPWAGGAVLPRLTSPVSQH